MANAYMLYKAIQEAKDDMVRLHKWDAVYLYEYVARLEMENEKLKSDAGWKADSTQWGR